VTSSAAKSTMPQREHKGRRKPEDRRKGNAYTRGDILSWVFGSRGGGRTEQSGTGGARENREGAG
jgi:hypothetical protein